jgi:hypothetical protein
MYVAIPLDFGIYINSGVRDPRLNSGPRLRSKLEPKLKEDGNGFLRKGNLLR